MRDLVSPDGVGHPLLRLLGKEPDGRLRAFGLQTTEHRVIPAGEFDPVEDTGTVDGLEHRNTAGRRVSWTPFRLIVAS